MSGRPSYKTFVVERAGAAPRDLVWEELLALIGNAGYQKVGDPPPHGPGATIAFQLDTYDLVEETLSLEPPWRRCYAIVHGAPLALYQATTAIRDNGATCLLVWSYLADAGDQVGADAFLERAQQALRAATERVAVAAEARSAGPT